MSRVRTFITVGVVAAAVAGLAYAASRTIATKRHAEEVADDIEAQLAALDPVTRTAVVGRLSADAAQKVRGQS
jgi:hypothetical protein